MAASTPRERELALERELRESKLLAEEKEELLVKAKHALEDMQQALENSRAEEENTRAEANAVGE
jgi:hypothetical protein